VVNLLAYCGKILLESEYSRLHIVATGSMGKYRTETSVKKLGNEAIVHYQGPSKEGNGLLLWHFIASVLVTYVSCSIIFNSSSD
jgi:hypothetical protein